MSEALVISTDKATSRLRVESALAERKPTDRTMLAQGVSLIDGNLLDRIRQYTKFGSNAELLAALDVDDSRDAVDGVVRST